MMTLIMVLEMTSVVDSETTSQEVMETISHR